MKRFLKNRAVLRDCKIYQMLSAHAHGRHLSFHMPGHKKGAWDITELSYSDNLTCPQGCIGEAERDIAEILGAAKSFILTDGSTAGVLSMLYAAKSLGVKTVAVCESSHKSVFNGCALLGLTPLVYPQKKWGNIPFPYTMYELKSKFSDVLDHADALFFTSPDYYGNVTEWETVRAYCDETQKLLLADGAHGGHLHFDKRLYAGGYADLWVDGVHKSLPAFTQGAVVSARTEALGESLKNGVNIFRTTSPSYPIMASVEYAVKYPRNERLEAAVRNYADIQRRVYVGEDWTKVCAVFGETAFKAQKEAEGMGLYPEFCDGNVVMFYLSPATTQKEWAALKKCLKTLFERYPFYEKKEIRSVPTPLVFDKNGETEWVELGRAKGRICAQICGLFPPCTPLLRVGEEVTEEKLCLLENADNVFGIKNRKILVFTEKGKE